MTGSFITVTAADGATHHPGVARHSMLVVNHVRPGRKVVEEALLRPRPGPRPAVRTTPPRDVGLGQDGQPGRREDEPAFEGLDHDPHPRGGEVGGAAVEDRRGQALLAQDRGHAPGTPLALCADRDRVPLADQATQLLGQPRRVGDDGIPAGCRDPRCGRCLGRRGQAPGPR